MKFWMKVLVVFLVIVAIGFAIWAFFIRDNDKNGAYSKTAQFIDYKYSTNINEEISRLIKLDYVGENNNILDDSDEISNEILKIRKRCLYLGDIVHEDYDVEIYRYQSYYTLSQIVDDIMYENLPYLKCKAVKNSYKRNVEKQVGNCISDLSKLQVSILDIIEYQKSVDASNDMDMNSLLNKYYIFKNYYKQYLNSASNLILSMQEYIYTSLYGNEIKMNVNDMLNDCFARQLKVMTSIDEREEIDRALAINKTYNKMLLLKLSQSDIFNGYIYYDVLEAYNTLVNNYVSDLDFIFSQTEYDKNQMAKGNNLSLIKIEAQPSAILVLKALGF